MNEECKDFKDTVDNIKNKIQLLDALRSSKIPYYEKVDHDSAYYKHK